MTSQEVPALSDVTVLDLSRLVSGNMLTHVLADMGAQVIKVEPHVKVDELFQVGVKQVHLQSGVDLVL